MDIKEIKQKLAGEKYEILIKKKLSIETAILNGIYFVYRKMYIEGIACYFLFFLLLGIGLLKRQPLFIVGAILFSLLLSLLFNIIYNANLNRKAKTIALLLDSDEGTYKKYGGTNLIVAVFVAIIIPMIIFGLLNMFLNKNKSEHIVIEKLNSTRAKAIEQTNNEVNNNVISMEEQNSNEDKSSNEGKNIKEDSESVVEKIDIQKEDMDNKEEKKMNEEQRQTKKEDGTDVNWAGTYKSLNEEIEIILANDKFEIGMSSINANGLKSSSIQVKDSGKNILIYTDYDDNSSIIIKRTANGIVVDKSSTIADDHWGPLVGREFEKVDFKSLGWTGKYASGNAQISLTELGENEMIYYLKYMDYQHRAIFKDYTAEEINYENEFLGEITNIKIRKTQDGFTIECIDSDEDSPLNELNGKTFKKI